MNEIIAYNQNYEYLPKQILSIAKNVSMLMIYTIPIMCIVPLGGKFGIMNIILIWVFVWIFEIGLFSYEFTLIKKIRYYQIADNQLIIKYFKDFSPKKILINQITRIDISVYRDCAEVSVFFKKNQKNKMLDFEVNDYSAIKSMAIEHKIPLSIFYSHYDTLATSTYSFPHIRWFQKEYTIQRGEQLPITKPELLNLYNSKFSIQFIGSSEDYFTDDDSIVDTFSLALSSNPKEAIDLYLEDGDILATTHQNKFKKALKEIALQLKATIG
ncbi:MAG: hypothetical protein MUE85_00455 [Microscillaceae bacterium]|jgi:hypothetical protein|nr:hypothetical protein [Microscillaceae bacterium]